MRRPIHSLNRAAGAVILAAALCWGTGSRAASVYGDGAYSSCAMQTGCAPTVTTAPSRLSVAVNLSDGQRIPAGVYRLVVTPLNSSQVTDAITRVVVVVNGQEAATFYPDQTGTAYWDWRTGSAGAPDVEVAIYTSQSDQPTVQRFRVKIVPPAASPSPGKTTPASRPVGWGAVIRSLPAPVQQIVRPLIDLIQKAPQPLVVTFPYLLLGMVGIGAVIAYLQTRREIAHSLAIIALRKRQASLMAEKSTFIQLVSHYLRTPMTILQAAIDTGAVTGEMSQPAASDLRQTAQGLHRGIEDLIAKVADRPHEPEPARYSGLGRPWLRPGFIVPVILLAVLLIGFNGLATAGRALQPGVANSLAQAVGFGAVVVGLYAVARHRQIGLFEQAQAERQHAEAQRLDVFKGQVIHEGGSRIQEEVGRIQSLSGQLNPQAASTKQIAAACARFGKLADAFLLAASLETGKASDQPQRIQVADLVQRALRSLAVPPGRHPLQIDPSTGRTIVISHPEWLERVCASVIDNALAYSQDGQPVRIAFDATGPHSSIVISDHGQGMPAAYLEHIFKPFTKADGGINFDHEGMGFSLFLDKLIMRYLNGDIIIRSAAGRGTTVTIVLPPASGPSV